MAENRLVGIDFSGDANRWTATHTRSNVWMAIGKTNGPWIELEDLFPIQQLSPDSRLPPFERLSEFLNRELVYAAIDAPFCVPFRWLGNVDPEFIWNKAAGFAHTNRAFGRGSELIAALAAHLAPRGNKDLRESERYWQSRGINVRSSMWAGPRGGAPFAVACMALLSKHQGPIWPFRAEGKGALVIEAFPAAQLRHWKLPHLAYNGHSERAIANRAIILTALEREHQLKIGPPHRRLCQTSADSLDAVICMFAANAVAQGRLVKSSGSFDQTEGLIAVHL